VSIYQPKTYLIKTFGCQANMADSNKMGSILEALGFEETDVLEKADIVIINTCSVRQKSDDKVYGMGKTIKLLNETGRKPVVILAGCVVGSAVGTRKRYELDELMKKTSFVDLYISPSQINELPDILMPYLVEKGMDIVSKRIDVDNLDLKTPGKKAYVNISYGCDNFCSFCVVPYARGKEISRSKEEILKEINRLVAKGVTDITLCGQNVNSWGITPKEKSEIRINGSQKLPFASLLREIHEISGIALIEFISSNPFDFTQDLVDVFSLPKVSNYLHIAVQSGNNEVLKSMNRRHTIEEFFDLVDRLKQIRPNIELGTDIIVGFPNETRDQFMGTVELFKRVSFAVAFISMYSPRKGTNSVKNFKDDVPVEEKKYRHAYLNKVWRENKFDGVKR